MSEQTGVIVHGGELIEAPFQVENFHTLDIPKFKVRGKIKKHRWLVQHENAGSINRETLYRWLQKKGYGYHFVIDPHGFITQHADTWDKIAHGGRCNKFSLGICLLNPYYPRLVDTPKEKALFEIIPAQWWTHCNPKSDRRYSRPTEAQIFTLRKLSQFLCRILDIPWAFPTKDFGPGKQRKIKNWRLPGIKPKEDGLIAHRDYSSHADGRYALERLLIDT